MKIAITGATGFIGSALVASLREHHDVIALTRASARAHELGVTAVAAELETPGRWCDALDGIDAIVHLAGESIAGKRWDARQKQIIRDSRVETSRTIVEAIGRLSARPKVLVSASAVDIYPFATGPGDFDDDEVTEADPPSDSFLGRLCRDWENEVRVAERLGVRVACMRTGLVLGPGGVLAKMKGPIARLGSGRQWMSWIHRDDVIAGYVAALADDRYTGPINLVTDSTRNADFMHALGPGHWLPVPAFAIRAAVGELSDYLLNGRRVVPAKLRALGFTWKHATLSASLAAAR